MELGQADRDKLRNNQYKLNNNFAIGHIVEHQTQNPRQYKRINSPGQEERPSEDSFKLEYQSKHQSDDKQSGSNLPSICEDDLPISTSEVQDNLWLNMDKLEFDKLAWTTTKACKADHELEKDSTKFDRDGRALALGDKKLETEPEDCHEIESLVRLLDSVYQPQVTYALNVITKIATLAVTGYYDGAFDENLHGILISRCLLRVRHHIDSSNETICQSAIKCLRALLCNTHIDEVILDRVHPIMTECLTSNHWLQPNTDEFGADMKDVECVEKDAIRTLVQRTSIIQRFTFLLKNKKGKFSEIYHECILDILIRIARHSITICELVRNDSMTSFVIEKFLQVPPRITSLPKYIFYNATKAMKLLRILYQALVESEEKANKLSSNLTLECDIPKNIKQVTKSYLLLHLANLTEYQDDYFCCLKIETLRLMKVLCKFKHYLVCINDLFAMSRTSMWEYFKSIKSLRATREIDSKISFDWQYAAHLIDLIGTFMVNERYSAFDSHMTSLWSTNVRDLLYDWITSIVRSKCVPHLDVSIAIAVGIHHQQINVLDIGAKTLSEIMLDIIIEENRTKRGHECDLWKVLVRTAADRSQLLKLSSINGCLRDPKSLPSFGCLNYNTTAEYKFQFNPLFESDSPLFLMDAYIRQLHRESSQERVKIFINNLDLIRYIRAMTAYNECDTNFESTVHSSIVAQYEVEFLARSISLMGKFYLEYQLQRDEAEEDIEDVMESQDLKMLRLDTYSNLCFYAISIIGLLGFTKAQETLKNEILQNILLSHKLQSRASTEAFDKPSKDIEGPSEDIDYSNGITTNGQMPDSYLRVLDPLYLSCEQLNRYWITQPLLNYYKSLINDPEAKTKGNKWFMHTIDWKSVTGEAAGSDDKDIVRIILAFNYNMLKISPSYNRLVVKPSLDDYLCIVGSVLLDDDIFLDREVNRTLASNLKIMLTAGLDKEGSRFEIPFQDANKLLKPLNLPLADFFNKLVDQFEAVSYGNETFSNFMLLFLTPKSDKTFRKKLFQEKAETCLGQLRIGVESLWLPMEIFFEKRENDPEVKKLIRRASYIFRPGTFLQLYSEFHSKEC